MLGGSTTQLFRNLSFALRFAEGDEIIISGLDHEANVAAWLDMAKRDRMTVKWWMPTEPSSNPVLTADNLQPLLSPRTRFVACTHTSNVLGGVHDIAAIAKTVHAVPGAMLAVDAVAYAPHRLVDVKALDVDFYCFSWYKVRASALAFLTISQPAGYDTLYPRYRR